MTDKKQPTV